MPPRRARLLALSLLAGVAPALAGCGDGSRSVTGAVSYDGRPVESGSISFEPADGQGPTVGGAIEAGHYVVAVPARSAGKKVVRIHGSRKTGRQVEAGMPAPKGTKTDELVFIPALYNLKSQLTADLDSAAAAGPDFDLKGVNSAK